MSSENEVEITPLKKNLQVQMARNELLEKENKDLRQEVVRLKSQIISLKAHNIERKSILWKKIQKSMDGNNSDALLQHKAAIQVSMLEKSPTNEKVQTNSDLQEPPKIKDRSLRVPPPPPRPASNPLLPSHKNEKVMKLQPLSTTAPPPPPTPPKSLVGSKAVRRVPEVIELYRSLTRKDSNNDNKTSTNGTPALAFTRNMIEEIENRSTFLSAIKSDVERQGEFISFLIKEVEELSSLVDERSVLKHFPHWPEQKADALREASCNYRDMKNLESEVSLFEDNPKEPLAQALKRVQALQDRRACTKLECSIAFALESFQDPLSMCRLETSVNSAERTRESASKRYRNFHIPWEWMLDTGLIGQKKLSSLRLGREFMKRVTKELESNEALQEDNLMSSDFYKKEHFHLFMTYAMTHEPHSFSLQVALIQRPQTFQELKKIGNARN
ncbi:Protein CHUP1, chloroplastic, partial [Mucuna pruriens]